MKLKILIMKKNFSFFFYFFLFFIFSSPVFSFSKKDIENKLKDKNINQHKIERNLNVNQEKLELKNRQSTKQSFDELKREKIIPDVIISIDSKNTNSQEIDKLIKKLEDLRNQGKKVDYYTNDKLVGIYIYLYGSEEKYQELRKEIVSRSIKLSSNRKLVKQYTPNDSYYSSQWNLTNIRWSEAMDLGTGSNPVTIGIIDNGVDVDDSDLSSNIWQNAGDSYGDLTDNDGNGYIDDRYGCNFYLRIIEGYTYIPCQKSYIKEDLTLDSKHGSYVAQVSAGVTNNSLGIAGVCSSCKVSVLKITDDFGDGYFDLFPYVFTYAINKNFKILNLSYGSRCPFDASEDIYAADINTLINTYGIMLVQAAGNNGSMTQSQCISLCGSSNPYCYSSARNQAYYYVDGKSVPNKINVASINSSNQRSSSSVYDGSNAVITIAAPGENIPVYPYSLVNGTSFSAPMVSGAIGFSMTLLSSTSPN
ncbi:MAG: S8 family serine peptidase [Microgenomates group bacterium]|nr:S8 family serine peptidase [Microgenomates group bacterium]